MELKSELLIRSCCRF